MVNPGRMSVLTRTREGTNTKPPDWRITKKGATTTVEGVKYDWCPHHGPNNRGKDAKKSGMYMPAPHNHDEWAKAREAKNAARKNNQSGQSGKRKTPAESTSSNPAKKSSGKLALAKSFKSALVSHVQLSDAEIENISAEAMKNCDQFSDNSDSEQGK